MKTSQRSIGRKRRHGPHRRRTGRRLGATTWSQLEPLEPRLLLDATATTPLNVLATVNDAQTRFDLSNHFDDPEIAGSVVEFASSLGTWFAEMFDDVVPNTVNNFLNYVVDGDFANSFIHRLLPGFVAQGGAFTFTNATGPVAVPTDPPVANEFTNWAVADGANATVTQNNATVQLPAGSDLSQVAAGHRVRLVGRTDGLPEPSPPSNPLDFFSVTGVDDNADTIQVSPTPTAATGGGVDWFVFHDLNVRGTLSPPKLGGDPDSATSGYFVNLANNAPNLDIQNEGFPPFGQVLFDGMDVVDVIEALQIVDADPPPAQTFDSLPVVDLDNSPSIEEDEFVRFADTAESDGINLVSELSYQIINNTNPALVTAAIDSNVVPNGGGPHALDELVLDFVPDMIGFADLTVRGTDLEGNTADQIVTVAVQDAFEPGGDDTPEQARDIATDGTPQTHNLHEPNDLDWITFTLASAAEVLIETNGDPGAGATVLTLFQEVGGQLVQIGRAGDGLGGFASILRQNEGLLLAGTYVVCVEEDGMDGVVDSYTLSVTETPAVLPIVIDNINVKQVKFQDTDGLGDKDHTLATLRMRNGAATLIFEGDGLGMEQKGTTVTVTGTNLQLRRVDMTQTNSKSDFSATGRGGDGAIEVDDFTADGDMKSINAKIVNLLGNITIVGALLKLILNNIDVNNDIIVGAPVVPNARALLKVQANNVVDTNLQSEIGIDLRIKNGWTDSDPQDADDFTIEASFVKNASFGGPVLVNMLLSGANAPRDVTLGSVKTRQSIDGGTYTVQSGDVGKIDAKTGIAQGWFGNFGNAIVKTIKSGADASIDLIAAAVTTMTVRGRVHDSNIELSQPRGDRSAAIKRMSATGFLEDVIIRTFDNISNITALGMRRVRVYAGYDLDLDDAIRLPDFEPPREAAIARVSLRERKAPAYIDSILAAESVGTLTLNEIAFDNGGNQHGLVADRIKGISGILDDGGRFRLSRLETPADLLAQLDGFELDQTDVVVDIFF